MGSSFKSQEDWRELLQPRCWTAFLAMTNAMLGEPAMGVNSYGADQSRTVLQEGTCG